MREADLQFYSVLKLKCEVKRIANRNSLHSVYFTLN